MTTTTNPSSIPTEWDRNLSTRAERYAAGKALRSKAPRSSHAEWAPYPERPDPISLLEESNKTRLQNLVPIRFGRMSLSAFTFYRGTADIMAYDLAKTPVSGIQAQLCGDAHIANFGVFASPERNLVFDVNDFDETLAGPWEWDVKRLAASAVVPGGHAPVRADDGLGHLVHARRPADGGRPAPEAVPRQAGASLRRGPPEDVGDRAPGVD